MGFGESAKRWVAEALFFCDVYDAPLLPLSLDRFPPNFPWTRDQVLAREIWFRIPEKFPLRDRISRKTVFKGTLGYPVCAQPTGHGKRSATSRLFPSHRGHPTDLSFLCDVCWGMYRFPAIRVINFELVQPIYAHGTSTSQTDGQTDGRTDDYDLLRASRGKNCTQFI